MLSRRAENYLRAIYESIEKKGYVKVKDIATGLGVKAPTVIEMLEKLNTTELIVYEKRGGIVLSEEGRTVAVAINERYQIFLRLFELAGVPKQVAYKDACALEHYIHDETKKSILQLVERLEKAEKEMRKSKR
jgi:DtxR family Mn-dependent transcriptional regulator